MNSKVDGIANSVLDLVGNTPLLALDRIWPGPGRLLGKCEFLNPTGSLKDRASLNMIVEDEKAGTIKPGQKIFEFTSGNQGAGIAMVCSVKKHPFTAIMSRGNSEEKQIFMKALGAKVILVDQVDGVPGRVTNEDNKAMLEYVGVYEEENPEEHLVNQAINPFNPLAHYNGTAKEIWHQTSGKVDAFCMVIGTSGCLMGTSKFLKEKDKNIKCYCVEPEGCEGVKGLPITKPAHILQGSSYGFVPPIFDYELIDGTIAVTEKEVLEMKDRLGREEGLYLGYTAAGNVVAAIELLKSGKLGPNPNVVTILCDTGLKYTS